ncbi:MOSC domain-containing protein [Saccharomonospora sp. NPDC046836]|uniref:MOSC domain-containing protein n=1 Tax=Saccharomonospora sp. NPDC046836 TaxID=3156921 RepID=UPI0033D85A06
MTGNVDSLYVYPIKGLSPQRLAAATLEPGEGIPHDRVFALARPDGRYVPGITRPLPKTQFFMLARDERLAGLATHLDPASGMLRVHVDGRQVLATTLTTDTGAADAAAFFGRALGRAPEDPPVLARVEGRRFTDVSVVSDAMMNAISLVNLASVRDLAQRIGRHVDPLRFRANVYVDGLPPWCERDLVGSEMRIGRLRLRVVLKTKRCAATEVDPATARRDLRVPRLLAQEYGHIEMGCYAEVLGGGTLRPGDTVHLDTGA